MRKEYLSGMILESILVAGICTALTASAEENGGTLMELSGNYTCVIEKRQSDNYVTVEYPVLSTSDSGDSTVIEEINSSFAQEAESYLEEQEQEMSEMAKDLKEYGLSETIQYLTSEITCKAIYLKDNIYSVARNTYSYTGGAHGYGMSVGVSYDLETGAELTMAELLGYEEAVAQEIVIAAYGENIIGQIENITEESIRESFEIMEYWMTEEGLQVSIPTYAVASYAAGPQDVLITPEMAEKYSMDSSWRTDDTDGNLNIDETGLCAMAPVTIINGIQADAADFIFPYSALELLTEEDLKKLEGETVEEEHRRSQLAINEMLARYGYEFKPEYGGAGKEAYDQFSGLSWYEEAKQYCPYDTANDVLYGCLNETELANVDIICAWQQEHGCYY